jgi:hypothetical protein
LHRNVAKSAADLLGRRAQAAALRLVLLSGSLGEGSSEIIDECLGGRPCPEANVHVAATGGSPLEEPLGRAVSDGVRPEPS